MGDRPELPRTEIESGALPVLRNADNGGTDNQSVNPQSRPRGPLRQPLLRAELFLRFPWEEEQPEKMKFS